MSALSVIVFGGPHSIGQLAAAEQVSAPTMTRVIRDLERRKLVVRVSASHDARIQMVRATALGTKLLIEGRRRRVARLAEALTDLPAADREQLAQASYLLERLARPQSATSEAPNRKE